MLWPTYSADDLSGERSQGRVNVVGDDADDLPRTGLDIASHVLVQHGPDISALAKVLLENSTAAEQTGLFARVPVELDGVLRLARRDAGVGKQDTEGLEDGGTSRSVIIYGLLESS